jgi:hypothetical protein
VDDVEDVFDQSDLPTMADVRGILKVTDESDWKPSAYVTAECRVTDLSPQDLIRIFKSRSFTVTTVVACEHAVGRTRERPSTFTIHDEPAIKEGQTVVATEADASA